MAEEHMRYTVPLIPQQTAMSCWAASIAMILSWAERASYDPATIARGRRFALQYQSGLGPSDRGPLDEWGLVLEPPQSYTVEAFLDLVDTYGPLWFASGPDLNNDGVLDPHIRVVTGFTANADPKLATVYINDPWERGMRAFRQPNNGSSYGESYLRYIALQEDLARTELRVPNAIYVAHLPERPHFD
jgi:hypothetical protein